MSGFTNYIVETFSTNTFTQYLACFIISMVPLIELRGAIPVAYIFEGLNPDGFNLLLGYILIAVGNMIPVPIIFFFARKVLEWGAKKRVIGGFFRFFLDKGHKGGQKLQSKAGQGLFVALMLFVGIPLPGTGAWTGTLAASILDMEFKESIIAVVCGVALAGIIVSIICALGFGAWIGIAG